MKTNRKQIFLILLLIFGLSVARAQNAVVTVGGDATGGGGNASYTIGQVVYTTATGTNGSANQGVQQPYEIYIVGIGGDEQVNLQLTVYPNPATTKVTLNIGEQDPGNLSFRLYDLNAKLLQTQAIQLRLTEIPMENLSPGVYILKVLNKGVETRTFKIIKK
ncbi:MAG: T9SS type A sorting domain-containing protein [Bacteroidota bacterium]